MERQKKKRSEMPVKLLRLLHELEVAGTHFGPELLEVGSHGAVVVAQVDAGAIFKEATPLWIEADHWNVIFEVAAGLFEDLPQNRGLDEDGRGPCRSGNPVL